MTALERVRRALGRLKIFPLPGVVLLPSSLLPLHVFEPRYRKMTGDCLSGDRVMAVTTLEPGWKDRYEGRPPVRPVAGVGIVAQEERLDDGRFNILVRGIARVRIDAEHPPSEPYREVRATLLEDDPGPDPSGSDALVEELRRGVFQLLAARPGLGDGAVSVLAALAARVTAPGVLADAVAGVLLHAPEPRQAVLETISVPERVALVTARVAELAAGAAASKPQGGYRN